jgi:thiamine kinase-like enzyme
MHDIIPRILEKNYMIKVSSLNKEIGGWSAYAYKVRAVDKEDYFLKVYDKHLYTSQNWIKRIENYMPVVLWLRNNSQQLQEKMPIPILTSEGSYMCENKDYVFILFKYIPGKTIGFDTKLSLPQQQELAEIISQLHSYGNDIPVSTKNLKEDFDVSFCDNLTAMFSDEEVSHHKALSDSWTPFKSTIIENAAIVERLAAELRTFGLKLVFCHTDVHGGNLMQADRLIVIDFEGLKLAPAEADLFVFTEGFFFDYAYENFMSIYTQEHPGFEFNQNALTFYRLRRRLEDIHEFAKSILYDNLSIEQEQVSLNYLKNECAILKSLSDK